MNMAQINGAAIAMLGWGEAIRCLTNALDEITKVIEEHRERWLCEGEGQWPDKFTILNRYVRTDYEPPFIFND